MDENDMDIEAKEALDRINARMKDDYTSTIVNPNYTKKNGQSKIIEVAGNVPGDLNSNSGIIDLFKGTNKNLNDDFDEDYADYGIMRGSAWTKEDYNKERARRQSNWEQGGRALGRIVGSELILGMAAGLTDIADFGWNTAQNIVASAQGEEHVNDFTNPISETIRKGKDSLNDYWAIHRENPDKSFDFGDFGWWADNSVSIVSSLTMLVPGMAVTKGLSLLGKLGKLGELGSLSRGIAKMTQIGSKASKYSKAASVVRRANAIEKGFDIGVSAITSRIVENYGESRDTSTAVKEQVLGDLKGMSDFDKRQFFLRNKNVTPDMSDEAIAETIALESANTQFRDNFALVLMDIAQFKAIGSLWEGKLLQNSHITNSMRKANLRAAKGLAPDALRNAKGKVKLSLAEQASIYLHPRNLSNMMLDEGVEEGFQGITGGQGTDRGKAATDPMFRLRTMSNFLRDESIYEQAFWGVVGGQVFQGGGRQLSKAKRAYKNKKDPNYKKGSDKDIVLKEIESRDQAMESYMEVLSTLNKGKNPYVKKKDENGNETEELEDINPEEQERLTKEARMAFVDDMTMNATDSGSYDLLKEFLESKEMSEHLIKAGVTTEATSQEVQREMLDRMDKVNAIYHDAVYSVSNSVDISENPMLGVAYAREIARRKVQLDDLDTYIANQKDKMLSQSDDIANDEAYAKQREYEMYKDRIAQIEADNKTLDDIYNGHGISKQARDFYKEKNNEEIEALTQKAKDSVVGILGEDAISNSGMSMDDMKSIKEIYDKLSTKANEPKKVTKDAIDASINAKMARDITANGIPKSEKDYHDGYNEIYRNTSHAVTASMNKAFDSVSSWMTNQPNVVEAYKKLLRDEVPELKEELDLLRFGDGGTVNDALFKVLKETMKAEFAKQETGRSNKSEPTTSNTTATERTKDEADDAAALFNQAAQEELDDESKAEDNAESDVNSNAVPKEYTKQDVIDIENKSNETFEALERAKQDLQEAERIVKETTDEKALEEANENLLAAKAKVVELQNRLDDTNTELRAAELSSITETEVPQDLNTSLAILNEDINEYDNVISENNDEISKTEKEITYDEADLNELRDSSSLMDIKDMEAEIQKKKDRVQELKDVNNKFLLENERRKNKLSRVKNRIRIINNNAKKAKVDKQNANNKQATNNNENTGDTDTGRVNNNPDSVPDRDPNSDSNITDAVEDPNNNPNTEEVQDAVQDPTNQPVERDDVQDAVPDAPLDITVKLRGQSIRFAGRRIKANTSILADLENSDLCTSTIESLLDAVTNDLVDKYNVSDEVAREYASKGIMALLKNIDKQRGTKYSELSIIAQELASNSTVNIDPQTNSIDITDIGTNEQIELVREFLDTYLASIGVVKGTGAKPTVDLRAFFTHLMNDKDISNDDVISIFNNIGRLLNNNSSFGKEYFFKNTRLIKQANNDGNVLVQLITEENREITTVDNNMHAGRTTNKSKETTEALDSLTEGDELTVIVGTQSISIKKGDIEIAYLSKVTMSDDGNTYTRYVSPTRGGFLYSVTKSGDKVLSNFDELFNNIIHNGEDVSDIIDIINKHDQSRHSVEEGAVGADAVRPIQIGEAQVFLNNKIIKALIERGDIVVPTRMQEDTNENKVALAKFIIDNILNIVDYNSGSMLAKEVSYTAWNNKQYFNYKNTHDIEKDAENGKTVIKAGPIRKGKLIIDEDNKNVSEAKLDPSKHKVVYVDPVTGSIQAEGVDGAYSNRVNMPAHSMGMRVGGTDSSPMIARFTDSNPVSSSKEMSNAVATEIETIITDFLNNNTAANSEAFNEAYNKLSELFEGVQGSGGLFYGYNVVFQNGAILVNNSNGQSVLALYHKSKGGKGGILYSSKDGSFTDGKINKNSEAIFNINAKNEAKNRNVISHMTKEIVSGLKFNRSRMPVMTASNVDMVGNYFYRRGGQLHITIGGLNKSYNNYGEAILEYDMFKTNQGVSENGDHFEGDVTDVALDYGKSSNEKEAIKENKTVKSVMDKSDPKDGVNSRSVLEAAGVPSDVIDLGLGDNIGGMTLFPETVYRRQSLGKNVNAAYRKGKMYISDAGAHRLSNDRQKLVRTFLHEQLHHRLDLNNTFDRTGIVEDLTETMEAFNTAIDEILKDKDHEHYQKAVEIKKNILSILNIDEYGKGLSVNHAWNTSYTEDQKRRVLAEEWLVESLTHPSVMEVMNSIAYDGAIVPEGKKSMWQKIIETIAKIFNVPLDNIENNTILARQLQILNGVPKQVDTAGATNIEEYTDDDGDGVPDSSTAEVIEDEVDTNDIDLYTVPENTDDVLDVLDELNNNFNDDIDNSDLPDMEDFFSVDIDTDLYSSNIESSPTLSPNGAIVVGSANTLLKRYPIKDRDTVNKALHDGNIKLTCKI